MATLDVNLKLLFFFFFFIGITVEAAELNPKQRLKRQTVAIRQWPGGVVLYKFGTAFNVLSAEAKKVVMEAMKDLSAKTCIRFKKRTHEINFLEFIGGAGCWSYVGLVGGKQYISIGTGCERKGVILHELAHALGFFHEQSRPDRDDHVGIVWGNVLKGYEPNFHKYKTSTLGQPYDYGSLLHYGPYAFTKNGKRTIVISKPGVTAYMGQRIGLSVQDVKDILIMYSCKVDGHWSSWSPVGSCSNDCGVGKQAQKRTCTNPAPKFGGKDCKGDSYKTIDCEVHSLGCVVDGCAETDSHLWCPYWSKLGFCSTSKGKEDYDYMMKNCKRSCTCKLRCRDDHSGVAAGKCPSWKSKGFCNHPRYRYFVQSYCKKTCGLCP